jgi:hypothetical protein
MILDRQKQRLLYIFAYPFKRALTLSRIEGPDMQLSLHKIAWVRVLLEIKEGAAGARLVALYAARWTNAACCRRLNIRPGCRKMFRLDTAAAVMNGIVRDKCQ